jgi:hypothetical protein
MIGGDSILWKAEGKKLDKTNNKGVNLTPSVDTGSGRKFKQENIDECFRINSYYFLYETVAHTDTTITFHIYWIPILAIKKWYTQFGKKGRIPYSKIQKPIQECEIFANSKNCGLISIPIPV